jgi:hypothetical protein
MDGIRSGLGENQALPDCTATPDTLERGDASQAGHTIRHSLQCFEKTPRLAIDSFL